MHLDLCDKVSSTEVTEGLHCLLGRFFDKSAIDGVRSHSLKATILTFVSVRGCDYTYSELLGYHLTQHVSAINYQRKALAAPIRRMMVVLNKIQEGSFLPCAPMNDEFPQGPDFISALNQMQSNLSMNLRAIAERFLGCDLDKVLSSSDEAEFQAMWDLLCQESRDIDPVIEPCVQGLFGAEENHEAEPDSDAAESDSESAEHAMADVAHAN